MISGVRYCTGGFDAGGRRTWRSGLGGLREFDGPGEGRDARSLTVRRCTFRQTTSGLCRRTGRRATATAGREDGRELAASSGRRVAGVSSGLADSACCRRQGAVLPAGRGRPCELGASVSAKHDPRLLVGVLELELLSPKCGAVEGQGRIEGQLGRARRRQGAPKRGKAHPVRERPRPARTAKR